MINHRCIETYDCKPIILFPRCAFGVKLQSQLKSIPKESGQNFLWLYLIYFCDTTYASFGWWSFKFLQKVQKKRIISKESILLLLEIFAFIFLYTLKPILETLSPLWNWFLRKMGLIVVNSFLRRWKSLSTHLALFSMEDEKLISW